MRIRRRRAAADDRVTVSELAALRANVTELQDELARISATVERLMKELGLPPADGGERWDCSMAFSETC